MTIFLVNIDYFHQFFGLVFLKYEGGRGGGVKLTLLLLPEKATLNGVVLLTLLLTLSIFHTLF